MPSATREPLANNNGHNWIVCVSVCELCPVRPESGNKGDRRASFVVAAGLHLMGLSSERTSERGRYLEIRRWTLSARTHTHTHTQRERDDYGFIGWAPTFSSLQLRPALMTLAHTHTHKIWPTSCRCCCCRGCCRSCCRTLLY